MSFADEIPERSNADTGLVDASWWNVIRTALIDAFDGGGGGGGQLVFNMTNNQSSYADITDLVLDDSLNTSYTIKYEIYRKTSTPIERMEIGYLTASFKATADAWTMSRRTDHGDDVLNIANSLAITTGGQVQYKSDNTSGTHTAFYFKYEIIHKFKAVA